MTTDPLDDLRAKLARYDEAFAEYERMTHAEVVAAEALLLAYQDEVRTCEPSRSVYEAARAGRERAEQPLRDARGDLAGLVAIRALVAEVERLRASRPALCATCRASGSICPHCRTPNPMVKGGDLTERERGDLMAYSCCGGAWNATARDWVCPACDGRCAVMEAGDGRE